MDGAAPPRHPDHLLIALVVRGCLPSLAERGGEDRAGGAAGVTACQGSVTGEHELSFHLGDKWRLGAGRAPRARSQGETSAMRSPTAAERLSGCAPAGVG